MNLPDYRAKLKSRYIDSTGKTLLINRADMVRYSVWLEERLYYKEKLRNYSVRAAYVVLAINIVFLIGIIISKI